MLSANVKQILRVISLVLTNETHCAYLCKQTGMDEMNEMDEDKMKIF